MKCSIICCAIIALGLGLKAGASAATPGAVYNDHADKFTNIETFAENSNKTAQPSPQEIPEKYLSVTSTGPLPPVDEATYLSKAGVMTMMNFRSCPVSQILDFYSDLSGMKVLIDKNVSASITYNPGNKRYSARQALIMIKQILDIERIELKPIDATSVQVTQH